MAGDALVSTGTRLEFALLVDDDIDIQVGNEVQCLYGLYATRGDFVTCNVSGDDGFRRDFSEDLGVGNACDDQLTVHGAVIARATLYPYRAYGHGTNSNEDPAERFILEPSLNLSDYNRRLNSATMIRTGNTQELPARF